MELFYNNELIVFYWEFAGLKFDQLKAEYLYNLYFLLIVYSFYADDYIWRLSH